MKFNEETIKVNTIEDSDIIYYTPLQRIGPATWGAIHNASYGVSPKDKSVSLKQQTFGQAGRLIAFALKNRNNQAMAPVIEAVHKYVLTGDTLALWVPEGLYAIDRSDGDIVEQLGVDNQSELKGIRGRLDQRLSGARGEKVITSEDGFVRFINYDNLAGNHKLGITTLVGNEETANALTTEADKVYKLRYGFYGVGKQDALTLRVPVFGSFGFAYRLAVVGSGSAVDDAGCSFGGMQVAKPLAENLEVAR